MQVFKILFKLFRFSSTLVFLSNNVRCESKSIIQKSFLPFILYFICKAFSKLGWYGYSFFIKLYLSNIFHMFICICLFSIIPFSKSFRLRISLYIFLLSFELNFLFNVRILILSLSGKKRLTFFIINIFSVSFKIFFSGSILV